jgi:hypothetical protein
MKQVESKSNTQAANAAPNLDILWILVCMENLDGAYHYTQVWNNGKISGAAIDLLAGGMTINYLRGYKNLDKIARIIYWG